MKKNLLAALVALMAFALSGNAQNNTYNMVIEMANGTKITIGPNDVKNISFNDGELVMTGEDINTLVERQTKTEARVTAIEAQGDEIAMRVAVYREEIQAKIAQLKAERDMLITDLKAEIARLKTELAEVSAGGSASIPTIGEDGYWYINGEKTNHYALGMNGADGRDADRWTIGDDGYWYRNGEKTTYRAVAQDGANVDLSEYATIDHVRQLIKDLKDIPGDAQIINPENGEPYTERVWDSSAGAYVDKPITVDKIRVILSNLEQTKKYFTDEIEQLKAKIESLRNQ